MMISDGPADGGDRRELNQLQPDMQTNATSTKALTVCTHALLQKHEPITQRGYQLLTGPLSESTFSVRRIFR
jgi:hypothetical protein